MTAPDPDIAGALERLLDSDLPAGWEPVPTTPIVPAWLAAAGPCLRCDTAISACITGHGVCCSACEHPRGPNRHDPGPRPDLVLLDDAPGPLPAPLEPDQLDADRYRWGTR